MDSAEHASINFPHYFQMPNGAVLSFGDIVALAGDYFASAKNPICFGRNEEDRRNRFLENYSTLANANRKMVEKILAMIEGQATAIAKAFAEGKKECDGIKAYKAKALCKTLIHSRLKIIDIFAMAFDHMEDNTILAHQAGHFLAMEAAAAAHHLQDENQKMAQLAYAYTLEAYAFHFLMDRFSAGHIRTPSEALYHQFGAKVGCLLAILMHDEENRLGLEVVNELGDVWKTYGDAHYFESYNQKSKSLVIKSLQIVMDEVFQAYQNGAVLNKTSKAYGLLPQPTNRNTPPMFFYDPKNDYVFYRSHKRQDLVYKKLTYPKIFSLFAHSLGKSNKTCWVEKQSGYEYKN